MFVLVQREAGHHLGSRLNFVRLAIPWRRSLPQPTRHPGAPRCEGTPRCKAVAVRAEREACHSASMDHGWTDRAAGRHVPKPRRAVRTPRQHETAVRAENG